MRSLLSDLRYVIKIRERLLNFEINISAVSIKIQFRSHSWRSKHEILIKNAVSPDMKWNQSFRFFNSVSIDSIFLCFFVLIQCFNNAVKLA